MRRTARNLLAAAAIGVTVLVATPAAQAAIPTIPNGAGGTITCTDQTGANAGERWCSGIFTTFDGAPLDINVGFPAAPGSGPDGDFPIKEPPAAAGARPRRPPCRPRRGARRRRSVTALTR